MEMKKSLILQKIVIICRKNEYLDGKSKRIYKLLGLTGVFSKMNGHEEQYIKTCKHSYTP